MEESVARIWKPPLYIYEAEPVWNDKNLLVGVHVNGSRSNDLKEEKRPVCCPLGAPLHCVKHASHLAHRKTQWKKSAQCHKDHYHHFTQPHFEWFKNLKVALSHGLSCLLCQLAIYLPVFWVPLAQEVVIQKKKEEVWSVETSSTWITH